MGQVKQPTEILQDLSAMLPDLEATYKDIHSHPELSMQETRTAKIAADHLKAIGFEVTTKGSGGLNDFHFVGSPRQDDKTFIRKLFRLFEALDHPFFGCNTRQKLTPIPGPSRRHADVGHLGLQVPHGVMAVCHRSTGRHRSTVTDTPPIPFD